jgi:hypothetical protein
MAAGVIGCVCGGALPVMAAGVIGCGLLAERWAANNSAAFAARAAGVLGAGRAPVGVVLPGRSLLLTAVTAFGRAGVEGTTESNSLEDTPDGGLAGV